MTSPSPSALGRPGADPRKPISVAIHAMGGQGGGVLTNWIVDVAEAEGWVAQSTSVPGVAQRTGATIYYVEMLPGGGEAEPVLAQMPTPGDVDVVIAAEYVEAGRSVLRGLVTPDRTTLIASTHRALAVTEKQAPGDGVADSRAIAAALDVTAARRIAFDMNAIAAAHGTIISAPLLGALAASRVLPFARSAFAAAIERQGKGVKASLAAFDEAFQRSQSDPVEVIGAHADTPLADAPMTCADKRLNPLLQRLQGDIPDALKPIVFAGLRRVVDYQDPDYGAEYLNRLGPIADLDRAAGGAARGFQFTGAAAKHVANAMCYDDVIRVADLKTRASRFTRIEQEIGLEASQLVYTTEYMHPRMEEVVGTLPVGLAEWLQKRPKLFAWLDRRINRGRRVRTKTLFWFLGLYMVSGLRPFRRRFLRHKIETDHLEQWLAAATGQVAANYDYGVELLNCRRLVKGYSDTHARGLSKFDRVMSAAQLVADRDDAGDWVRRLREAALADEDGEQLDGAVKTIESFASEPARAAE